MIEDKGTADGAGGGALKVLAVDDDGLILMNMTALLEDLGHEVLEASSGEGALDIIRAHPDLALVLTDHAMPRMTGVELAQAMARERPQLPFIIATGYGELPEGAPPNTVRLAKPYDHAELTSAMQAALGRS